MISEFVDLRVQTQGRTKQMRFLVTDLGTEDLILGYPWLAIFELKFQWRDASICNGLAPFVRLGPLKSLKSTKYQRQT